MTAWLLPVLSLLLLPGSSAAQTDITGPKTVSGLEQGSLTVCCKYASKWKTHKKWWCRGAEWSSCRILVITNGSEQEVKKERLSVRDHQKDLVFKVTLEDLRRDDADTYWCGIRRTGADPGYKVKVTIGPGLGKESSSSVRPSLSFTPSTTKKTTSRQPVTTTRPSTRSLLNNIYFLLLVFLELPLLLSMLGAILWVNRPLRGPRGVRSQPNENQ